MLGAWEFAVVFWFAGYGAAYDNAADVIEKYNQLECQPVEFIYVDNESDADLIFEYGSFADDRTGETYAYRNDSDLIYRAEIVVRRGLGNEENTFLHEFGHALGFGHSSDNASVMWPLTSDVTEFTPDISLGLCNYRDNYLVTDAEGSYGYETGCAYSKPTKQSGGLFEILLKVLK